MYVYCEWTNKILKTWIFVYLWVYLFLKLSFLFVFQSGENTNQNRYGASFVPKFIRESMTGPSGPPSRAQSGVKSTWVVPKILWWVTLFNEFNLLSMYVVTPILEGLRPPRLQNLQNRRFCVLNAKTPKICVVLKILLLTFRPNTPKSEVLRTFAQKLQNRRFCAHRKNSKIGGFA